MYVCVCVCVHIGRILEEMSAKKHGTENFKISIKFSQTI